MLGHDAAGWKRHVAHAGERPGGHSGDHAGSGRLGAALNEMLVQIEAAAAVRAASESRLRRFVADAAHELRTPLTSLRGYAELYRQGALTYSESVGSAMHRIESEGARMARLVDDLLLLARLDQQRSLETSRTSLTDLVREAVDDFRVVAPDRPIEITGDGAAFVEADPSRLRQVIDNLLTNTRIHTPTGTPVHVDVSRRNSDAVVAVREGGRASIPRTGSAASTASGGLIRHGHGAVAALDWGSRL